MTLGFHCQILQHMWQYLQWNWFCVMVFNVKSRCSTALVLCYTFTPPDCAVADHKSDLFSGSWKNVNTCSTYKNIQNSLDYPLALAVMYLVNLLMRHCLTGFENNETTGWFNGTNPYMGGTLNLKFIWKLHFNFNQE